MVVYVGKSIRQFGQGIVDILNKEEPSDALEDGFEMEYVDNNKKTVVLDLD